MPWVVDLIRISLLDNAIIFFFVRLCMCLLIIEVLLRLPENLTNILRFYLLLVVSKRVGSLKGKSKWALRCHGKSGFFCKCFISGDKSVDIIRLLPLLLHFTHPFLIIATWLIIIQVFFVEGNGGLFGLGCSLSSVNYVSSMIVFKLIYLLLLLLLRLSSNLGLLTQFLILLRPVIVD